MNVLRRTSRDTAIENLQLVVADGHGNQRSSLLFQVRPNHCCDGTEMCAASIPLGGGGAGNRDLSGRKLL